MVCQAVKATGASLQEAESTGIQESWVFFAEDSPSRRDHGDNYLHPDKHNQREVVRATGKAEVEQGGSCR